MLALLSGAERNKMGQSGRKYAENNLSMDRFVDEYECLFRKVISE